MVGFNEVVKRYPNHTSYQADGQNLHEVSKF